MPILENARTSPGLTARKPESAANGKGRGADRPIFAPCMAVLRADGLIAAVFSKIALPSGLTDRIEAFIGTASTDRCEPDCFETARFGPFFPARWIANWPKDTGSNKV